MPPCNKLRNFVFTINNYELERDRENLEKLPLSYAVGYHEVGPSGTPHIQGYAELSKQVAFNTIVTTLERRAHIEARQGPVNKAVDYCKKGEQPHDEWQESGSGGPNFGKNAKSLFEIGALKEQGKRSDLEDVVASISAGKRIADVAAEHPLQFIKYAKGIQTYFQVLDRPRDKNKPLEVVVHYGPTGTGKTLKAMLDNPDAFKYSVSCAQWFDGYDAHTVAVIDEFRGQLPFAMLLQLLDVYPLKVQVKGGFREWKPDKVIITSPVHPKNWYSPETLAKKEGSLDQLKRRVTAIYFFGQRCPTRVPDGWQPTVVDHTAHSWKQDLPQEPDPSSWDPLNGQFD